MTNSIHSFELNTDIDYVSELSLGSSQEQRGENAEGDITYSIFLNGSDLDTSTRNGGISNTNDRNQKNLKSSRLYKFILSTDEINSTGKNFIFNNNSKNQSSLSTLSTGILNSTENIRSDINNFSNSKSEKILDGHVNRHIDGPQLINIQSSPLDNLIQTSDEYFTAISSLSSTSKIQNFGDTHVPFISSTPRHNRFINKDSLDSKNSKNESAFNMHKQMNTRIDEAVELLKDDYISKPQTIKIRSEPSVSSIEFEPHDFQIAKKFREKNRDGNEVFSNDFIHNQSASNKSSESVKKINKVGKPLRTSLLDNIIVPSYKDDSAIWNPNRRNLGNNIKILDNMGDSWDTELNPIEGSTGEIRTYLSLSEDMTRNVEYLQNDNLLSVDIPSIINSDFKPQHTSSSSFVTSVTPKTQISSVADLPPSPTYESANDNSSGGEDNYGIWNEYGSFPIQHIDSSSIKSFGLDKKEEYDEDIGSNLFSLMKIMMIIFAGIIVPPIFFLVAFGENSNLLSDYVLLKLMMKRSKRIFLLQGFIWDIDLRWFRRLCLWLGITELLLFLACVAIGFSVGLTR